MKKVIKKIKKIMAEIDNIEEKEEALRDDLSEAVEELEESTDD